MAFRKDVAKDFFDFLYNPSTDTVDEQGSEHLQTELNHIRKQLFQQFLGRGGRDVFYQFLCVRLNVERIEMNRQLRDLKKI